MVRFIKIGKNYVCKYWLMLSPYWSWDSPISLYKRVYWSYQNEGLNYELGANGTAIEGDWDKVFECVKKCHKKIHSKGASRIYTTMKVNTRTDKEQKFSDKVKSVLDK